MLGHDADWTMFTCKQTKIKPQKINRTHLKGSCEPRKEKPVSPHDWNGFLKGFFIPGVHGKNPSRTAATASQGSSWKVLAWRRGKGRRTTWSWTKSIVFQCRMSKSPGGAAPRCGGHIKISDRLQPHFEKTFRPDSFLFFPPTTDPSHFPIRPLLTSPCHCSGPGGSKRALQQPLSVRWHHVMKLAVVAKQVSIKELEPRPHGRRSWITSFTDLWATVWHIVAAFFEPSFIQVVPPRIKTVRLKDLAENAVPSSAWWRTRQVGSTVSSHTDLLRDSSVIDHC